MSDQISTSISPPSASGRQMIDDIGRGARGRNYARRVRALRLAGFAIALAAAALLFVAGAAGAEEPAWTTFHHDAERTGGDPGAASPLTPTLAWQSPGLGAPIWGQPLVLGSRVYVATVGDGVYALD